MWCMSQILGMGSNLALRAKLVQMLKAARGGGGSTTNMTQMMD